MAEYAIVPATAYHAVAIARNMRESDAAEVWASHNHTPYGAITKLLGVSRDPLIGMADGEPVCVFGHEPVSPIGVVTSPWLLGTDAIEDHYRAFLRMSKRWVEGVHAQYSLMFNYVDARNTASVRWLKWLGFQVYPAEPFGAEGLPFHYFDMRR